MRRTRLRIQGITTTSGVTPAPHTSMSLSHGCRHDLSDFWAAAGHQNLPAVSFLKAGGNELGGCGCSSPCDEQQYETTLVNRLQKLPSWKDTAVVVM